ncbi:hypothetical protein G3M48_002835 [Beauveria asiatica]|uniref:Uncharacterized protein n=1 Tax=Beauveria asiatica TaxID=1069075 RepID=A0AAW0S9Q6_9HYPO
MQHDHRCSSVHAVTAHGYHVWITATGELFVASKSAGPGTARSQRGNSQRNRLVYFPCALLCMGFQGTAPGLLVQD